MIPTIICFIFGHRKWGKTNFRAVGDQVAYDLVKLEECFRCGEPLITPSKI